MAIQLSALPILILSRILSISLVVVLGGLFLYVHQKLIPIQHLSFQLKRILAPHHEKWRMLSSQFMHANVMHILFNVVGLLMYSSVEAELGFLGFLRLNMLLVLMCGVAQLVIYYVLWKRFGMERYHELHAVGYSCVLFGILTNAGVRGLFDENRAMWYKVFGLLMPYVSLILTQIIVPRASLIGHLSGILMAYPLSIEVLVDWMNWWWVITCLLLVLVLFVVNIKYTHPHRFSWMQLEEYDRDNGDSDDAPATMVGGRLVRQHRNDDEHPDEASNSDGQPHDANDGDSHQKDSSEQNGQHVIDMPPSSSEDDTDQSGNRLLGEKRHGREDEDDIFDAPPPV